MACDDCFRLCTCSILPWPPLGIFCIPFLCDPLWTAAHRVLLFADDRHGCDERWRYGLYPAAGASCVSDLCIRLPYGHYGVSEEAFLGRLDDMVEQAFDDQCTGTNPRYPLMKEIKEMYLNAYYGG